MSGYDANNPAVGAPACAYATLDDYNPSLSAGPVRTRVVPTYGGMPYTTLQNDSQSLGCSGYFAFDQAYPSADGAAFSGGRC